MAFYYIKVGKKFALLKKSDFRFLKIDLERRLNSKKIIDEREFTKSLSKSFVMSGLNGHSMSCTACGKK